MPAQTTIYLGPAGSGKTRGLICRYREALLGPGAAGAVDRGLWLAPTSRSAAAIREELLADGLEACLAPNVMTFDELTGLVLRNGEVASAAAIGPAMQRELLRRIVRRALEADQLTHFKDAATRTGFIDLLLAHIRELQRYGVSPTAYAKTCRRRDRAAEHSELGQLYAEYERQLTSHALCDTESRHATARDVLAADRCRRLRGLELVAVDGFTDFTQTQHELLQLLARRTKQLIIALPHDDRTRRPELFAKTRATLAELAHFHANLEVREFAARSLAWPALDHVAQHLFANPRQVPPLPAAAIASLDRLEIVEAAGAHDEIVEIARRIKRQLVSNEAKPGDVVVVFRSLADAAPRVREVFSEFGIPYALETGLPLASSGVLKTLLSLLRLAAEDWPFRRVVSVLTDNTLTAIAGAARQAAEWLVRDLQIASGRDELVERVEQLGQLDAQSEELPEHMQRRAGKAKAALPAIHLLADALDRLPKDATPIEWRAALTNLCEQLRLDLALDADAWQCVAQHFAALERLDAALGESTRRLSRGDLLEWLVDLARHERLPRTHDDVGRVRVLEAATARTITAKHLYLAGMSEQAFPSPERAGNLSTSDEYRFFARAAEQTQDSSKGVPLAPPVTNRGQEEMLLFYEVLTEARESLTISYPALDDKAQQLSPSPYVTELVRTLDRENKGLVRRTPPRLSPIPSADAPPLCPTDWRVVAVAQAVGDERDARLLAGIFQASETRPVAAALEAGLRVVHARQRRDDFGPSEGLLTSTAVAARLAERFGPTHLWSPSQWERYAACPYKFYLEDVLKLEPLGDLTLETDYLRRGSLVHGVLAQFHRKYGSAAKGEWADLKRDGEQFLAELQTALVAAVDAAPREGISAALVELDRRQIEKWFRLYRGHHEKYDAEWTGRGLSLTPTHLEFRFGPARAGGDADEDPKSVDTAFELDVNGEKMLVTGRIDRIDVGQLGGKTVFNVIDYKSGTRPTLTREKIEAGERLQPALYVMAAEALVFGADQATPLWAGYWSMKNGVTTKQNYSLVCSTDGAAPSDDWQETRSKVVERIGQFVAGIRGGEFPVASRDDDCTSRCEFRTVCRVGQVRSLNKVWPPEAEPK